jgi:hypothetical protein
MKQCNHKQTAAEKTESAVLNISGPLCCMYANKKSMFLLGFFDLQSCHSLAMSLECQPTSSHIAVASGNVTESEDGVFVKWFAHMLG